MQVIEKGDSCNMDVFKICDHVIAADTEEDARSFYQEEVGKVPPAVVEELSISLEVPAGEGNIATIRDLVNKIMDERNAWLRMGVPCELHYPFIVAKL
jgi:alkanesulfonate monooxygenase SsuD/methylene tetrahydromethanopterin reductase-like flavin-dependent oxidoreductase (luciferase family)